MRTYSVVLPARRVLWRAMCRRAARDVTRVAFAVFAWYAVAACADAPTARTNHVLLVFPEITGTTRSQSVDALDIDRSEFNAGISAFLARDFGQLRGLAEVLLATDDQDIERAQLGYKYAAESVAWVGRFHNPLGFWNTYYHHGAFLQTSISRPSILEYDDHGGPLPSHLAGVLIDGAIERQKSGWSYQLAAGAGPELGEQLEPVHVLRPSDGSHKLNATLRLSFRPDVYGRDEAGVYYGHNRLAGAVDNPVDVSQRVAGGFVFWQWSDTVLRTEAFYVSNDFDTPLAERGSFLGAYAQLEQRWRGDWTGYGRAEDTRGADADPYLARFPRFPAQRQLLGLRYDVTSRQSLKLEVSYTHLFQGEEYSQVSLQWAAVFP